MSKVGVSVRNLRNRLGFSQEELAERADLHRTYIAGIESGGRNMTLKSVEKLAAALNVSVGALLGPTDTPLEILLVEDNPDDLALTVRAFREARLTNRLHVVRDGAEALDFLFTRGKYADRAEHSFPQVVLLDLDLPKLNGPEVLRQLRADPRTRNLLVIVLTISHDNQDMVESMRLGADTYLVKPVTFQTFSEATPRLQLDWALRKGGG